MTVLYKLAQGQLSRQYHYDFGLRALKAVLVMAGELKRGSSDLDEVGYNSLCNFLLLLLYMTWTLMMMTTATTTIQWLNFVVL